MRVAPICSRLLPGLALACLCTVGPHARAAESPRSEAGLPAAPSSAPPPTTGLRQRGGFVTLSPGIVSIALNGGVRAFYVWGVDGGYHLPIGRVFALQAGGFFEHATLGNADFVRFGGIGRFGGGNDKLFGYGLVRLGPDFAIVNLGPTYGRAIGANFHGSFGGGIMGMVHRIVGLGGETAVDLVTSGPAPQAFMRLRFFIALKF